MNPSSPEGTRAVVIHKAPIELCQFLKFAGAAESGGQAKQMIAERLVLVNGVTETRKGKKLAQGDLVTFGGKTFAVTVG